MNTKGKRISWNLNGSGGYRVGNEIYLDYNSEWNKIILVFDPTDRA